MPSLVVADLLRCLLNKLLADETPAKRHRAFEVYHPDGTLVARTRVSHSWRGSDQLGGDMVSTIRRQLNLENGQQLAELISCTMTRDEYLELALF